jgi:hypothetical protein
MPDALDLGGVQTPPLATQRYLLAEDGDKAGIVLFFEGYKEGPKP